MNKMKCVVVCAALMCVSGAWCALTGKDSLDFDDVNGEKALSLDDKGPKRVVKGGKAVTVKPKAEAKPKKAEPPPYVTPEKLRFPFISHYYVKPTVTTEEKVSIGYYVTDFDHRKVRFGDDSERFDVTLRWSRADDRENWETLEQKGVPSGDGAFAFGPLAPGEYVFSLVCRDRRGLDSRTLWSYFQCVKPSSTVVSDNETVRPTQAELAALGVVSERPGRYVFKQVDVTDLNFPRKYMDWMPHWQKKTAGKICQSLRDRMEAAVPSNDVVRLAKDLGDGYAVYIPSADGVYLPGSFRYSKVIYGPQYDQAREETIAATNTLALTEYLARQRTAGKRKVVLPKGVYRISCENTLFIPSGLTLDLNGSTLKVNRSKVQNATAVKFLHAVDSHLVNGVFEGNLFEYDYKGCGTGNPEHVEGVYIAGACRRCTIENVDFRYTTAWGIGLGWERPCRENRWAAIFYPGSYVENLGSYAKPPKKRACLEPWTEEQEGRFLSPFFKVNPAQTNLFTTVSRYLGYQGYSSQSWYVGVSFYDQDKKPLRSETAYQYHRILIPRGAAFMRVAVEDKTREAAEMTDMKVFSLMMPEHCVIRNCTFAWCRNTGITMYSNYNTLVENIELSHCGDESCKCAIACEDGWDAMQNTTFRNIRCHDNPNGDFTMCCGHDFVFENCDTRMWLQMRLESAVVRNCRVRSLKEDCARRVWKMYPRFENNAYLGGVDLGMGGYVAWQPDGTPEGGPSKTWETVIYDADLRGTPEKPLSVKLQKNGRFRNCQLPETKRK